MAILPYKDLTLGERLEAAGGRPSGFDYMRLVLALSIICYHSVMLCYGGGAPQMAVIDSPLGIGVLMLVPMFFALSGFLVAGSLARCRTIIGFLGLRVLRIVPALAGEVTLSALVLGPLLTNLPLGDYFADAGFKTYFLNIFGDIHYELPGVFVDNPIGKVNGQLRTIPFELLCYEALAVLAVLGVFRRRALSLWLGAGLFGLAAARLYFDPALGESAFPGGPWCAAFLAGLLLFQYRDRVKWNAGFFACALALAIVGTAESREYPWLAIFAALPLAYMTVWIGLLNPPRQTLLLSGDYSYGLYLYGFPVQQTFVALLPAYRAWYYNIMFAAPGTFAVAIVSWWCIEKQALRLREPLKAFEQRIAGRFYFLRRSRFDG